MVTQKSAFAGQHEQSSGGMMETYMESGREMVSGHPLSATMTAFGVGLGVGLVVATMLGERRHIMDEPQSFASKIGKKVMDAINEHVPDSMRNRFGCS